MSFAKKQDMSAKCDDISDKRSVAQRLSRGETKTVNITESDVQTIETFETTSEDKCFESSSQTVESSETNGQNVEQIDVKPILKRKSLDETEIKTLPSILKKRDSFDLSSKHTVLKRHSLGSESDHRNPSVLLTTTAIDIWSKPSSSSKPLSQIHSILKHKSLDEKFLQTREDHNLPKPILKKNLSIEDEIEKCLNLNNGTNGANTPSNATFSQSITNSNLYSFESNLNTNRTRSILKTGLEHQKRVVMNKTVEMKSILKTGHKNDSKPVKSALKKSDQSIDNKSEVKSILKTESFGSNEKIDISDTSSSSSDENNDLESNVNKTDDNNLSINTINTNNNNHNNNNGNTVPAPNSCALKQNDENKSNQRSLSNNKRLDHKRPTSCIIMSTTKPIEIDAETIEPSLNRKAFGGSISDRLAALKRNGEENWRKKVQKDDEPEVTLRVPNSTPNARNRSSSIADRVSLLEDSSIKWKNRVEEKDVKQFTIEAKMLETDIPVLKTPDVQRKTPKPIPFRSEKTASMLNSIKTDQLIVPQLLTPLSNTQTSSGSSSSSKVLSISIPKTDDEDFNSFFSKDIKQNNKNEKISDEVFDEISAGVSNLLPVIPKKCVKTQSRRMGSSNPIRKLAERTDFIVGSYLENSSQNETNSTSKPKKSKDLVKSSSFAASALAGLASREDLKAVAGKLRSSCAATRDVWKSYDMPNSMQNLMLVQIKGRRRAQTRLVEPKLSSINSGDSYILVSRDSIWALIGLYSNIIERTKTLEISNQIQEKKDLCFRSSNPLVLIDSQKSEDFIKSKEYELFLKQLNATKEDLISPPKSPEEDEIYEEAIIGTNLIYRVINEQLVPYDEYWGRVPRVEMLTSEETFVFDFGSEMYVWVGNRASNIKRKCALDSAKELWNKGYNYSECDVNPFGMSADKRADKRPHWSWFMKVNQNMESVLFKDKFLNWPSITSALNSKSPEKQKDIYSELNLMTIDAKLLIETKAPEPDMILETAHLGRGVRWDDELEGRHISITSLDVKCWLISEYEKHELSNQSMFYFYSGDTYVVRWHYRLSRVGRQLKTGNISRHSMIGRDRNCYFFWHGFNTKSTEKGASALMTVELDKEKAHQVRVSEGKEEPCFLNIFKGALVVLRGKRGQKLERNAWKAFYVRGVVPNEACLVEVECRVQSLRSRMAFVFVNSSTHLIYVWNGCKCLTETREVMKNAVEKLINYKSPEIGLKSDVKYTVKELEEGKEGNEFWDIFEKHERRHRQQLYYSLIDSQLSYSFSPRLFNFSSSSGEFKSKEILCSYRSCHNVVPYPFTQEDLYSAQQPTFFLFDNQNQIFLWESKFAFSDQLSEESEANTMTGSVNIRWNAERKCALDSTLAYCYAKNSEEPPNAYVICAGLEPDCFCALFPQWKYREDVALIHIQDGRKPGEMVLIQEVLSHLRTTGSTQYSLEDLSKRPLPEGLNPLCLESYLKAEDFKKALGISREEFYSLSTWKQKSLKQKADLF